MRDLQGNRVEFHWVSVRSVLRCTDPETEQPEQSAWFCCISAVMSV